MLYRDGLPSFKLHINWKYKFRDVMTCIAVAGVHRQDKGLYPTEAHTTQYAGSVHLSSVPAKPLSCLTARSTPFSGPPIDSPIGSNEASLSLSSPVVLSEVLLGYYVLIRSIYW